MTTHQRCLTLLITALSCNFILSNDCPLAACDNALQRITHNDFAYTHLEPWPEYEQAKYASKSDSSLSATITTMLCAMAQEDTETAFRHYTRAKFLAGLDVACIADATLRTELLNRCAERLREVSIAAAEKRSLQPKDNGLFVDPSNECWRSAVRQEIVFVSRLINHRSLQPTWIQGLLGAAATFHNKEICEATRQDLLKDSLEFNMSYGN